MCAGWFVSFCYNENIDNTHNNWQKVSTAVSRSYTYYKTRKLHVFWLKKVLEMNDKNLNKNRMGLTAFNIKTMAKELLDLPNLK